ncbi:hypothetical protein AC230_01940 [Streptomyces caatingaensis]|uniref:Uncharacterized protein n=1 Tax=Streptomyces caatingaensis TaxID=1678637 RepID=A0A0K9XLA1_9ACTN|nr:hypothetical protein AC230_01940 [Streptomyces caatingaensis]
MALVEEIGPDVLAVGVGESGNLSHAEPKFGEIAMELLDACGDGVEGGGELTAQRARSGLGGAYGAVTDHCFQTGKRAGPRVECFVEDRGYIVQVLGGGSAVDQLRQDRRSRGRGCGRRGGTAEGDMGPESSEFKNDGAQPLVPFGWAEGDGEGEGVAVAGVGMESGAVQMIDGRWVIGCGGQGAVCLPGEIHPGRALHRKVLLHGGSAVYFGECLVVAGQQAPGDGGRGPGGISAHRDPVGLGYAAEEVVVQSWWREGGHDELVLVEGPVDDVQALAVGAGEYGVVVQDELGDSPMGMGHVP